MMIEMVWVLLLVTQTPDGKVIATADDYAFQATCTRMRALVIETHDKAKAAGRLKSYHVECVPANMNKEEPKNARSCG